MDSLEICAGCDRHIKVMEAVCPFCGAARTPHAPLAWAAVPRVSRAAWLAATLTLVGCSGTGNVRPTAERDEDANASTDAGNSGTDGGDDGGFTEGPAPVWPNPGGQPTGQPMGQQGCYGAPPMRQERQDRVATLRVV
jgi:hypothetical protein